MSTEQKKLPGQHDNPNGLHCRYHIEKIVPDGEDIFGAPKYVLQPVDSEAEYFILRLDKCGSDPKHIAACRKAIIVYANEIAEHLPKLATDLIKRYSDLDNERGVKSMERTDEPYTWSRVKDLTDVLTEDQLQQPVKFWSESDGGRVMDVNILDEDYVSDGEAYAPKSEMDPEYIDPDLPKVPQGTVMIWLP